MYILDPVQIPQKNTKILPIFQLNCPVFNEIIKKLTKNLHYEELLYVLVYPAVSAVDLSVGV